MATESSADGSLSDRLLRLEDAIAAACRAASRPRSQVTLMAVSKTHPVEAMMAVRSLGLTLFGENRVQEFAAKASLLPPAQRSALRVHLIGHLQSNKAARAVELFDGIDSLDSLPLAQRLHAAAAAQGKILPVLLEIKLSDEPTKSGLVPGSHALDALLEQLPDLSHLRVDGLMTIAPLGRNEAETRSCFRALRQLRDQLQSAHPRLELRELSMGMSSDFPLAIAEGATRIRVGTALFGSRSALQPRPAPQP